MATHRDHKAAGFAHLTICVGPDGGTVKCYPDGEPEQLARGLALLLKTFTQDPGAVRCAAGLCDGSCAHGVRRN
jgi:hypothetical protein